MYTDIFDVEAFDAYKKATGGKEDRTTGLLTLTEAQFNDLQDLNFDVGGVSAFLVCVRHFC